MRKTLLCLALATLLPIAGLLVFRLVAARVGFREFARAEIPALRDSPPPLFVFLPDGRLVVAAGETVKFFEPRRSAGRPITKILDFRLGIQVHGGAAGYPLGWPTRERSQQVY